MEMLQDDAIDVKTIKALRSTLEFDLLIWLDLDSSYVRALLFIRVFSSWYNRTLPEIYDTGPVDIPSHRS